MSSSDPLATLDGWPGVLSIIVDGRDLKVEQARLVMDEVLHGRASDAQLGALLAALATKGPAVDEIDGFVQSMLAAAEPLDVPEGAIDIVGTGGSSHRRRHALNISTMASFVAASCGAVVCKHGNRRASSTSGAFDFLMALGVPIEVSSQQVSNCIARTGIGFAFARSFHPSMRFAGPVRSELGIPTVFNTLGPLANPGRVRRQLVGASSETKAESLAEVLVQRGSDSAWVVSGHGGLDELSLSGPSVVFAVDGQGLTRFVVDPGDYGFELVDAEAFRGGDATENVAIFEKIVANKPSAQAEIVILNAAAALVVAKVVSELGEGIERCRHALASGAVESKVDEVRSVLRTSPTG